MKLPISMRSVPPPAIRRSVRIPPGALHATVPDLCRRAGIPVQATTDRPVILIRGRRSVHTPALDLVAVPCAPRSSEGALRALEILAHGFHDPCARHCICGRGYFTAAISSRLVSPRGVKSDQGENDDCAPTLVPSPRSREAKRRDTNV